jgi:hypothetical protein
MFFEPAAGVHESHSIYKDAQRRDLFKNFLFDHPLRMAAGLTEESDGFKMLSSFHL